MKGRWLLVGGLALAGVSPAQQVEWPSPRLPRAKLDTIGPYNARFIAGGDGISRPAQGYVDGELLPPAPRWTLSAWIKAERRSSGRVVVGGLGTAGQAGSRTLILADGRAALLLGDKLLVGGHPLPPRRWHHVAAVDQDGELRLFLDGEQVASGTAPASAPAALVVIGPRSPGHTPFAGAVAALTYVSRVDLREVAAAARRLPDDELVAFEDASPSWPLQVRTQYGEAIPQRAWTLPRGQAPFSRPTATRTADVLALAPTAQGRFAVNGWRMAEAPLVPADGAVLSRPGFDAGRWYAATVPGTALTTLVDRGVYPDPRFGLNNMAIPERLARQDYWYRTEFAVPAEQAGKRLELIFNGINYAANVWVNGRAMGDIKGAFVRGRFDVTGLLRAGERNAIAVRVSPPPHPGIPHEQSLTAGRGENGGAMQIDGPTFSSTEGWDWLPGVRDRNTGLWQGVELAATDAIALGDPKVVTMLPKPDNSLAEIHIDIPLTNAARTPLAVVVRAAFDDVVIEQSVTVPAGASITVNLRPKEHPALRVAHPKLWWPNGYGDPALHTLRLSAAVGGAVSDTREVRFGIRQVTYELSSLDDSGDLRRIQVDLGLARQLGTPIIDERHQALRKVPGGWADSLFPGAERSPAVSPARSDPRLSPHLVLHVNGVPIAARGGNWGMDDMMKRVDRPRLEPYFRLHREAGMNIIRNWMGQSTEEAFYALADQYGLMVINDFWESTQDNDAEAEDVPLFVANARDTVRRFRNHPSIVLWIGRNEGVPQPILQTALQDMVWQEDGTRLYKGNSRIINFAGSGPYNWREPAGYFTGFARGFAVEVGTYSFPTREAWARAVPAADRWPINDTWAYHDWHQERAVAVTSFNEALTSQFGAPSSLDDFERKAQMLNYESHRAIFEGFNAGLWTTNSARMLWMSHPAWPSTDFQIYSWDYDTHASFYGAKKGMEPLHVQMNLPDRHIVVANTTLRSFAGLTVRAHVVTLNNREVLKLQRTIDVPANGVVEVMPLDVTMALTKGPVLIRLEATAKDGSRLSDNFYWQAEHPAALKALTAMPTAHLTASANAAGSDSGERVIEINLVNDCPTPAIEAKLTLFDAKGQQILPAYFSDNYISLLPGEARRITVRYPMQSGTGSVRLRGFNLADEAVR
ncbi:glycosyl hydrolase 2 galactose-binding domain-containing protein [Sphingomonas sp. BAUL-RG-20F-R05-02]|uniref:glycosyl hydrolase 2 galactose-binding domain-containing protein n=1 Tax=Sphingomonas sp. BAUL-RG-20F-R05-02 TaxID=2914830 RepID=UPI001F581F15|nr:LamG-like jellyroll fold domain-containing protein [Sphingomonas sp. BAUL-RG-20F-R05-02]